ncbi:STAS domain-containing protein [Novosphingobium umbonatum]|uniref:STAS domain-containing protein n=1 Tax=Novosphingobium umbonatum TaxID=1908524 RepID=A0A437NAA6_9SPHN|nr:STAS domain-containing protein [Novosphingobium umbonatum]RVU06851.1 STAS domain-containing protein [Novosphingobium umbonatum]
MSTTVPFGEIATVQTIAATHASLTGAMEGHASVALDLAGVKDADLSLLQLVEVARAYALREHKAIRLTAPANAVVTALLKRAGMLTKLTPETIDFWFHGEQPA